MQVVQTPGGAGVVPASDVCGAAEGHKVPESAVAAAGAPGQRRGGPRLRRGGRLRRRHDGELAVRE